MGYDATLIGNLTVVFRNNAEWHVLVDGEEEPLYHSDAREMVELLIAHFNLPFYEDTGNSE